MRAFARRPVARAAGETLAAWATEDFLAEHALVGLTVERFLIAGAEISRPTAGRSAGAPPAYAPITAPAGNHRSSSVTTACPSARSVSSAVATSPAPRVSSRPVAPGLSASA